MTCDVKTFAGMVTEATEIAAGTGGSRNDKRRLEWIPRPDKYGNCVLHEE